MAHKWMNFKLAIATTHSYVTNLGSSAGPFMNLHMKSTNAD